MPPASAVRLVHFSDIHLAAPGAVWRPGDWFSKRLTGWMNLRWSGRGKRFRQAKKVLAALADDVRRQPPDSLVFAGDATALGFEEEFAEAAALLGLNEREPLPGLAVPGNHDYYTRGVAASGLFERYFAPWQTGRRIGDHRY